MKIVSISPARLAARIGSYLNATRLANIIGADAKIYWPASKWEVNNADEIFSEKFIKSRFVTKEEISNLVPYDPVVERYDRENYINYLSNDNGISVRTTRPFNIPDSIDLSMVQKAQYLFSEEDLSDRMREIVSRISARMEGVYIGVHIRRGDILDYEAQEHLISRYEPISVIIKALKNVEERHPGCRFIFASDDASIRKILTDTFKSGRDADSLVNDIECTDLQAALRDMLILSKCQTVIGPWFSGFSSIGALMGGKEREEFSSFISLDERITAISQYVDQLRLMGSLDHLAAIDLAFLARALAQKKEWAAARSAIAEAEAISPDFVLFHEILLDINFRAQHIDGTLDSLRKLTNGMPSRKEAQITFSRRFFAALNWLIPSLRAAERHLEATEAAHLGWRHYSALNASIVSGIRTPTLLPFHMVTGSMRIARQMAEQESLSAAKINAREGYEIGKLAIELGENEVSNKLYFYLRQLPENPWSEKFSRQFLAKNTI